jgi:hypothetical protein
VRNGLSALERAAAGRGDRGYNRIYQAIGEALDVLTADRLTPDSSV